MVRGTGMTLLKSIHVHLSPGSGCVNSLYRHHILYLWHTFHGWLSVKVVFYLTAPVAVVCDWLEFHIRGSVWYK